MNLLVNRKYINGASAVQILVLQGLVLAAVQYGVHAASCPPPCKCAFDDVLQENMGTCEFGDSVINITWKQRVTQKILTITCQGSTTNFTCEDLPQFDFRDDHCQVRVEACSPRVLNCVNGIFDQPSIIASIVVMKLIGPYTVEDFAGFNKLHDIYIHLNDADKELPVSVINSLKSIKQATIVGGTVDLVSNVFNQTEITNFHLENNNIRKIPHDAFKGLINLKQLAIEDHNITEISPDAFRGLTALGDLFLQGLRLKSIDPEVFLTTSNLVYLSLNNIQIEYFPKGFLERFDKLEMVHIKNNDVSMTLGSQTFARLPLSVEGIMLNNCQISSLPEDLFKGSNHLRDITISNNMIEVLPSGVFSDLFSIKEISLKNNSIRILDKENFSKMNKLTTINLSYNHIDVIKKDIFAANPDLKDVYLHHNNISHLDLNVFNGKTLRKVDLSSNKLQRVIGGTISWETRKLNLSDNNLRVFEDWFVKLNRLIHLDLTHNKIMTIKESRIYSFNSRTVIDLRNNKISHIERDISDTNSLSPNGNMGATLRVYLSNNPLQCGCVVISALKDWNKRGILADYKEISCVNGAKLANISNKEASLLCNKDHALIGLIGTSTIGSLILIMLVISIYARRKIFWGYILTVFNQSTENMTVYEMQQDSLKQYDLFVSFAHQDGEFVADELLPKLEKDFSQKVCVHYRDWTVGRLIPDQIIQSVEGSRMTIIILTEHFLESEWSYLEFRTAHNLSIQEGKSRVIIILLEESVIKNEKFPDDLKSYVAVNTYLSWGDPNFWDKLQKVLPRQGKVTRKNKNKINKV